MTEQPYSLAITKVFAEFTNRDAFTLHDLIAAWTDAVQAATGRDDVEVWSDVNLEPVIVFPSGICLDPWEADLIDGVMTPEAYMYAESLVH